MARSHKATLAFIAFAVLIFAQRDLWLERFKAQSQQVRVISGQTMGTSFVVKIADANLKQNRLEQISTELNRLLLEVNMQMSTYIGDSELSRFNKAPANEWFSVSAETLKVVSAGIKIGQASDGAFDMTVGPVVNLWGFGPQKRLARVPDSDLIKKSLALGGLKAIETRIDPPALKKTHHDVYLDLSGIAKGYGVDLLAASLKSMGQENFLVEIGGEIKSSGLKFGQDWDLAIERPDQGSGERAIFGIVHLGGRALATSGDYRNFYELNGRIYSHLIDPRTGYPIEHRIASVSVLCSSSMEADAWATAFSILPLDKIKAIAEREQIGVLFVESKGKNLRQWYNKLFAAALKKA